MPITVEEIVDGSAFCQQYIPIEGTRAKQRCRGYEMRPCKVVRAVKTVTYYDELGPEADLGGRSGDTPYSSFEYVSFHDQADRTCPFCGEANCAPTLLHEHVEYQNFSLRDPDELLGVAERRHQEQLAAAGAQGDTAAALREMGEGFQAMALAQREEAAAQREQNALLRAQLAMANGHEAEEPEPASPARPPRKR